jgi:predicted  nucleic acid-binding Zn-ribbon protein
VKKKEAEVEKQKNDITQLKETIQHNNQQIKTTEEKVAQKVCQYTIFS